MKIEKIFCLLIIFPLLFACNKETKIPNLEISQENLEVDHQGFDQNGKPPIVILTANAKWQAQSNKDWLKTNINVGGTRTLVTINVTPNFTGEDRDGEITFTNEHASATLKVHQKTGEVDVKQIIYELPVIFHVMYNEEDIKNPDLKKRKKALNSEDLQKIIHEVNRLYGAAPINKIEEEEDQKNLLERNNIQKIDTKIRFVLANKDPEGKPVTNMGVTRTPITEKFIDPYTVLKSSKGSQYHSMTWRIDQYVNVFIFPFAPVDKGEQQGMILGISSMPMVHSSQPLDGLATQDKKIQGFDNYNHCIVLNAEAFEERVYGENKTYLGSKLGINTLAHELGHYLGLLHVFSEKHSGTNIELDSCEDTDYCKDTPSYNRVSYVQTAQNIIASAGNYFSKLEGLMSRTDCSNGRFISINIMDYEWSFSDRFTQEQVNRMRHTLYYAPTVPGEKLVNFEATRSLEGVTAVPHFSVCNSSCTHSH